MLPPAMTPPAIERAYTLAADSSRSKDEDLRRAPIKPGQVIGQAVLRPSGDIIVTLDEHFLSHDGVLHTSYRYLAGTKGYDEVIANLGTFQPGEYKTVYAKGLWAP